MSHIRNLGKMPYISPRLTPDQPPLNGGRYVMGMWGAMGTPLMAQTMVLRCMLGSPTGDEIRHLLGKLFGATFPSKDSNKTL